MYFTEVLFDLTNNDELYIKDSGCSCPVSYACKHVAALSIFLHFNPFEIKDQDELVKFLSKQKKEWLLNRLLEFAERDSKISERLFKFKDGMARKRRRRSYEIDI